MKKPAKRKVSYYDWSEIEEYINKKYKCDIRNFAGNEFRGRSSLWDFWPFLCSSCDVSQNGVYRKVNWADLKFIADEEWQEEICDLFIKEFGKSITVCFWW